MSELLLTDEGRLPCPRCGSVRLGHLCPTPAGHAAVERAKDALRRAEQFITNGIELGYIRMPATSTPDSAHDTLPAIQAARAALASVSAPPGFVMVPREPTEAMLDAVVKLTLAHAYALHAPIPWAEGYRLMIASAAGWTGEK
jgi:hypothetical protein